MTQTLTFLPFGPDHLPGALRLSRAAGWPHRAEDWALVLSLSQGLVALEGQRVVATALVTPFGAVGMVNMIIVDEAMSGRGLGGQSMTRAMGLIAQLEWSLVATPSGQPLYEKLGFLPCGAIHQHQGLLAKVDAPQGITWAAPGDLDEVIAMDRAATGADRAGLIRAIAGVGRLVIAPGRGYAALRPFGRGEVAGPVIADTPGTARVLLAHLFATRPGAFIRVDTTGVSGLEPWLADIGLAEVDRGVAMTRGIPQAPQAVFTRFVAAAQALG